MLVRHAPRLVHVRSWLAALAVASLLAAVLAGTAAAQSGPTLLSSPTVSPLAGDPTTLIQFGVRWVNHQGSAPAYVDVVIDGPASHGRRGGRLQGWRHVFVRHHAAGWHPRDLVRGRGGAVDRGLVDEDVLQAFLSARARA